MAKNEMKTIELKFKVDLKVKVDPSGLEAFEARLADNTPQNAAASQLVASVTGKGWIDTVPNHRMLLADPENLKAVLDAAGFMTAAQKADAEKERAEAIAKAEAERKKAEAAVKRSQASNR